jgi:hypothetical protein
LVPKSGPADGGQGLVEKNPVSGKLIEVDGVLVVFRAGVGEWKGWTVVA